MKIQRNFKKSEYPPLGMGGGEAKQPKMIQKGVLVPSMNSFYRGATFEDFVFDNGCVAGGVGGA